MNPITTELIGFPASGKSSLEKSIPKFLNNLGVEVIENEKNSWFSILFFFIREFLSKPKSVLNTLYCIYLSEKGRPSLIASIFGYKKMFKNWFNFQLQAVKAAKKVGMVISPTERRVQLLWRLMFWAEDDDAMNIFDRLKDDIVISDIVILLHAEKENLKARFSSTARKGGSINKKLSSSINDEGLWDEAMDYLNCIEGYTRAHESRPLIIDIHTDSSLDIDGTASIVANAIANHPAIADQLALR
jgi:hypothetical protein